MRDSRSILVVGGAGYIGSHMAKFLSKRGYEPVTLDDLSTGHHEAVRFGPLYEGSYDDVDLVEKVLKRHNISTVMHFGAKALVAESVAAPLLYYSANVAGTLKLLQGMIRADVKNFIFSSTCATFGNPTEVPIHERLPQKPINPYGQSKLMIEHVLKDMKQAYGINSAVLRYFNAAGADPEGELGELHENETHLIPLVLQTALGRRPKITVYGSDYPTPDGSCIRDYIHVNDLADAHLRALELIAEKKESYDFNLGSEKGYSVFDVINTVEKVTGCPVTREIGPRRPGDPPTLVADSTKAKSMLDWTCEHSLELIVRTAAKFMENNPHSFKPPEH